jgi:hypothetical protein
MRLSLLFAFLVVAPSLYAEEGLIIHGAEIGVAKFHRQDNRVNPYADNSLWKNYILPDVPSVKTPMIKENADGSITIFYSHLEELLSSLVEVSKEKQKKVMVFNINAHGLPGAMWFPVDDEARASEACSDWVKAANGDDLANYNQYYSPVSKSEIMQLRVLSYLPIYHAPCTTGVKDWRRVADKMRDLKSAFASDAQIHFFSCVVGFGRAGEKLVSSIAPLLLSGEHSKLEAAMNFGLGDWSIPEGMGFWDFLNNDQLERDNKKYPVDRKDREMMQKGSIRMAESIGGKFRTGILHDLDFMFGGVDHYSLQKISEDKSRTKEIETISRVELLENIRFPLRARIPGTETYVEITP